MTENILDYNENSPKKQGWIKALFIVAVVLFLYWYFSGIQKWPLSNEALALGLIALATVSTIRFFRHRKQGFYQYCYYLGKLALFIAIFLNFNNHPYAYYAIYLALGCFGLGVFLLYKDKSSS